MPRNARKGTKRKSRNNNKKRLIIGIVGKAGSGKTEVGKIFKKLGAKFIDADKIVHNLYKKKEIMEKVIKNFGKGVLEKGVINRKKLRKKVFENKKDLHKLEKIIWPPVKKEITKVTSKAKGVVVVEAAKLYEAGMGKLVDKVVLVDAKKKVRVSRLKMKLNKMAIERLMNVQRKKYPSDYRILNNLSKNELERRVKKAFGSFKV